jgi:hypothetical protein
MTADGCDANQQYDRVPFEFYPVGDVGHGTVTAGPTYSISLKRN